MASGLNSGVSMNLGRFCEDVKHGFTWSPNLGPEVRWVYEASEIWGPKVPWIYEFQDEGGTGPSLDKKTNRT